MPGGTRPVLEKDIHIGPGSCTVVWGLMEGNLGDAGYSTRDHFVGHMFDYKMMQRRIRHLIRRRGGGLVGCRAGESGSPVVVGSLV